MKGFGKDANKDVLLLLGCLFFLGRETCYADTNISLIHPGATEYNWYADGVLQQTSNTKEFVIPGDWPFDKSVKHSFTAVNREGESTFESAPLETTIVLPDKPAIDKIKVTITFGGN